MSDEDPLRKPFSNFTISNCRASYSCPQDWQNLDTTKALPVRHCCQCVQDVYPCLSMRPAGWTTSVYRMHRISNARVLHFLSEVEAVHVGR